MALIVQKYGGTSVGSIDRIREVAARVIASHLSGDSVVVVSSAMAGETNRLVSLAKEISTDTYSRDYDMVIASGEQVAIGLLSLAINTIAREKGIVSGVDYLSRPFLGYQVGIMTDPVFSKARIQAIDTKTLNAEISKKKIPIIAGFQGVDDEFNITTLGRGGSDTSAVAIAAALKADVCDIYTDVDGVYTTDPRVYPGARKISQISYEEMMEMAGLGAKVLQIRSVELAAKFKVPVRVRSSFNQSEGTLVTTQEKFGKEMETVVVAGVASDSGQVKITCLGLPTESQVQADIFGGLASESVVVDIIVQDFSSEGKVNMSFTVSESDESRALATLGKIVKNQFPQASVKTEKGLSKVSIIGVGMQHHPGVAAKMFTILAKEKIAIQLTTTSEIKVSCLVPTARMKDAVRSLHQGFSLDLMQ